jgi:PAS domain S-box-containing protein
MTYPSIYKYLATISIVLLSINMLVAVEIEKVTLQLKWKHQFQFAGYYAAIEKGYYEAVGLQVELVEAVEGINSGDAVFEGKAQFGICGSDILLMRSQNKKAVVLAPIFQHSAQVLVVSAHSGIEHLQDLTGKRIALEPEAVELLASLKGEGVSLKNCIVKPPSFDINQLISDQVDALSAYSTDELFGLKKANFDFMVLTPVMSGIDFYGDVLFTTEALIRQDPRLADNFRKASIQGWKYAIDHQEEIISLIYNKYSKRHTIEHLRFEADQMKNLIMANVVEVGYNNPGRWKAISDNYKDLKMVDPSFSTDGLLYSDYTNSEIIIPWKLISVFLFILFIITFVAWFFYKTSEKLKTEINRRLKIESDLRESEQRYRLLIETSQEGILVAQKSNLRFVNPMMRELTGYNEQQILTIPFLEFIDPCDREMVLSNQQKRLKGEVVDSRYHIRLIKNDKSQIWVEMSGVKIEWEGEPATMNFVTDITERKKAEEEISLKNDQLVRLNGEKDKFFSIIAHDMRSPFSGFLGLTEIMAEDLQKLTMEEIQHIAVSMKNSASNLFRLLENLLEWARMQQGLIPFDPQFIPLGSVVEHSIALMVEPAKNKGIEIECQIPAGMTIFADENMLNTVLRNLISNAIKFTRENGIIVVLARESDNNIEISVRDNGIGMSQDTIDHLFRLDVQTSRKGTNNEPSSGLGLLLCNEFIEKHNGTIRIRSQENVGTIFYFTLPGNKLKN